MQDEEEGQGAQDNNEYIQALQHMRETTVPKETYEKLKAENKQLLQTLVEGGTIEREEEDKESVEDLRKKLFSTDGNLNNLDYISGVLDLRDALLAEGKPDPFLPWGKDVMPTREEVEQAERVARVFRECVDYADGDSEVFTNELQRRTVDVRKRA